MDKEAVGCLKAKTKSKRRIARWEECRGNRSYLQALFGGYSASSGALLHIGVVYGLHGQVTRGGIRSLSTYLGSRRVRSQVSS